MGLERYRTIAKEDQIGVKMYLTINVVDGERRQQWLGESIGGNVKMGILSFCCGEGGLTIGKELLHFQRIGRHEND